VLVTALLSLWVFYGFYNQQTRDALHSQCQVISRALALYEDPAQAVDTLAGRYDAVRVTLIDPANTYVDAGVSIGQDTIIWPGAVITGETTIGANCTIGPHARLDAVTIGDGCEIRQGSFVTASTLGNKVTVGPFAYIRPDCDVRDGARVGAHTELVRSTLHEGVKMSHFSYIGDTEVGEGTNIGAGAITCNYDGKQKNHTKIGDGAFIGSDAILVAPVTIGAGAYVGAGSVITKDVPPQSLGIGRATQETIEGWARRRKQ
jgi:bifunctional UDP-N-acetylglucosamine pyrophosphorylase/glucosamine-1-phosphate N-acetyltransferase